MTLPQSLFFPNDLVLSRVMLWSVNAFILSLCVSLATDFLVLFIMDYLYIQAFGKSHLILSLFMFISSDLFRTVSQQSFLAISVTSSIFWWGLEVDGWPDLPSSVTYIFLLSWNCLNHNKACVLSIVHST
jgi:hypothetical protein